MGCNCGNRSGSAEVAYKVTLAGGRQFLVDTEYEARAAVVAGGGGTWRSVIGDALTAARSELAGDGGEGTGQ